MARWTGRLIQRLKTKRAVRLFFALLLLWYLLALPRTLFHVPYATVVMDHHGELLGARIARDGQWRFPPCQQVSERFEACIIDFEDRYFMWHPGVNPLAIGRALWQNIREKRVVSGGSTITMQTVRLSRGERRTVREKVVEAILATRLELRYSKSQILAMYASHASFGGNVVGLDAAAWRYFGHSAESLSWAEAATLAVLPNAPSMIHLSKNRGALQKKRDRLLTSLYQQGKIEPIDYELAIDEELPGAPLPLPQIAPHLVSLFHQQRRGEQVVTSIDRALQEQVEQLLERWHRTFMQQDIRHLAAIVVDLQTKRVVSYCGNVDFEKGAAGSQVDLIRSPRSSGSILKPFLYYTALQEGTILPHTLLPDIPLNISGFSPQNFSLQYDGAVPASEALSRSLNVPFVVLLRRYGVPNFYTFMKRAGVTTFTKPSSHYGLSLILGGAETTLWEVTSLYADMGRSLERLPPLELSLLRDDLQSPKPALFLEGPVWQTFEALKEVYRPEEIDWQSIPSMQPIAWKTGTSYGFRDAWAVGVSRRYVVGVWVGNASGEARAGLIGARTAGPVMFDLFNLLPSTSWFTAPLSSQVEVEVCRLSGHLKGRFCDDTELAMIAPQGEKSEPCPYHRQVHLTPDRRYRVYEHCLDTGVPVESSWFVLPPVWAWYYQQQHPEYQSMPPFMPGCGEDGRSPMQFIYPQANARISLPRQLDGGEGEVTFEVAHSSHDVTIFWHLDQTFLAETRDFHKITLSPPLGKHSLTLVDSQGNTVSITIYVE